MHVHVSLARQKDKSARTRCSAWFACFPVSLTSVFADGGDFSLRRGTRQGREGAPTLEICFYIACADAAAGFHFFPATRLSASPPKSFRARVHACARFPGGVIYLDTCLRNTKSRLMDGSWHYPRLTNGFFILILDGDIRWSNYLIIEYRFDQMEGSVDEWSAKSIWEKSFGKWRASFFYYRLDYI